MDIKDSYLHGSIGVVKSIDVNGDKLIYTLAAEGTQPIEKTLPTATLEVNGLLSSLDKIKLDSLSTTLGNYVTLDTDQEITGVKTFTKQLKFTVELGTAPFAITSTTKVTNLNVDYLDGLSSSSFARVSLNESLDADNILDGVIGGKLYNASNFPYSYYSFLSIGETKYKMQFSGFSNNLKYRAGDEDGLSNKVWREVAFIDSNITGNASTATKLVTERKLWGLDFDGSADVSGDMIGVRNINIDSTNNSDRFITFDTNKIPFSWRLGYLGSGSDNANYFVIQSGGKSDSTEFTNALQLGLYDLNATFAGIVIAPTLQGNLDGSYINALSNYAKAESASDIITTDTLNSALGKLEYKADTAYDWIISVTTTDTDKYINKWDEIVGFLDSVKEDTDITDEFVTRKTAQTITGSKTFSGGILLNCGLNINSTNPITWNDGTYHQRIQTIDDSTTNTAVFTFQQSSDTGSSWTDLFTIKDNGHVIANKFITSGGTSSQFVKGDGSLDSTTYVTTSTLDNYVTLNTAQNIDGLKTFLSNSSTTGVSLILRNKGWAANMSTALDFYNGRSYTVPNARIETKMVGAGDAGGTLIFYTLTKHAETNPNPNGLTERLRISDDGFSTFKGNIITQHVASNTYTWTYLILGFNSVTGIVNKWCFLLLHEDTLSDENDNLKRYYAVDGYFTLHRTVGSCIANIKITSCAAYSLNWCKATMEINTSNHYNSFKLVTCTYLDKTYRAICFKATLEINIYSYNGYIYNKDANFGKIISTVETSKAYNTDSTDITNIADFERISYKNLTVSKLSINENTVLHAGNYTDYKHAYTNLTGSTTTANLAIVSSGAENGWTLKTLGSNAFSSTAYLPLSGGTMSGHLNLTTGPSSIRTNDNKVLLAASNSSNYSGVTEGTTTTVIGNVDYPLIIRTNNTNITHFKFDTAYAVIDTSNTQSYLGIQNKTATVTGKKWYRIAKSPQNIGNCLGNFRINVSRSSYHTNCDLIAGTSYGADNSTYITVLSCNNYTNPSITKARIVYHSTYANNYAYLEVYVNVDNEVIFNINVSKNIGWTLITPEDGSIPSGYKSKEIDLTTSTLSTLGDISLQSTTSNGNTPRLRFRKGTYNDDYLDWDQYVTGSTFKLRCNETLYNEETKVRSESWKDIISATNTTITTSCTVVAPTFSGTLNGTLQDSPAWDAITTVNKWSRILTISGYNSIILNMRWDQNTQALSYTYLISTGYQNARITQLAYNGYGSNSDIQVRIVQGDNASTFHVEVFNKYGYNTTTVTTNCRIYKLTKGGSITPIKVFTESSADAAAIKSNLTSNSNISKNFYSENSYLADLLKVLGAYGSSLNKDKYYLLGYIDIDTAWKDLHFIFSFTGTEYAWAGLLYVAARTDSNIKPTSCKLQWLSLTEDTFEDSIFLYVEDVVVNGVNKKRFKIYTKIVRDYMTTKINCVYSDNRSFVISNFLTESPIGDLITTSGNKVNSKTIITDETLSIKQSEWTNTGYTFTNLKDGTYLILVTSKENNVVNLLASGTMSVCKNLQDTKGDEIPLHVYGTANWRPYLRTYQNNLLIASTDINSTDRTVTIKIALIL